MNQQLLTKYDIQIILLLRDTLEPYIIDKYTDKHPMHSLIMSDSQLRTRALLNDMSNLHIIFKEYGFNYPVEWISIAIKNNRKRNGNRFPSWKTLRKWFNRR